MTATRILCVRHGETDWNRHPRFRGRIDVPLNRTGVRQAERAGTRLAEVRLAAVYASPLGRTMRTASAIADLMACRRSQYALSIFTHDGRSLVATSINDTAHLDPPRR